VGVLPTRLSAVDEAASIDVLCVDKTGTLTLNALTVTALHPAPSFDEAGLLGLAAVASADGGQDPVDAAIRSAASIKGAKLPKLIKFIPFRSRKEDVRSDCRRSNGAGTMRVVKGAYAAVIGIAPPVPELSAAAARTGGEGLSAACCRDWAPPRRCAWRD